MNANDANVTSFDMNNIAKKLNKSLESRVNRDVLIDKAILKDPNDKWATIQDRGGNLDGLLKNRPTRDRLQRMNVIKEDESVAPVLVATRDKLKKQQEKAKLESFLLNRPEQVSLKNRRIIIDEVDGKASTRSRLEKLVSERPNMSSLVEMNIIKNEDLAPSTSPSHQAYVQTPTMVNALATHRVVSIGVGWSYTCALTDSGQLFSFGSSDNGRLGHDATSSPFGLITSLGSTKIKSLAAGPNHLAAISEQGTLYVWGEGQWGRLGLGDHEDRFLPTEVARATIGGGNVVDVSCGAYHTIILTDAGRVFAAGWNKFGRLGLGATTVLTAESPVESIFLADRQISSIKAGWVSSAAISARGELYTWGCGMFGVLGHGDEENQWTPKLLASLEGRNTVQKVALGEYHMLCLVDGGNLMSWGRNDYHQLGNDGASIGLPALIPAPTDLSDVAAGKQYSFAIERSGKLYSWGRGASGVLGLGHQQTQPTPTLIPGISDASAAAGCVSHSAYCSRDGRVFTFGGRGANGQLGL